MKSRLNEPDLFEDTSKYLRESAWDIVENWLRSVRGDNCTEEGLCPEDLIDRLPTLIGGVARIVNRTELLLDLEPGGRLWSVAREFGRLRQDSGYPIGRLLNDFSLLRQHLWLFCERSVDSGDGNLFELERRLNLAIDRITGLAVETYFQRSLTETIALAQRDKLTGCLNRAAFTHALDEEICRSRRYRYDLALLAVDIDGFRRINLEEGRIEGNLLLKQTGTAIGEAVRDVDAVARPQNDDFFILMPQTKTSEAKPAAERIRRSVRSLRHTDEPLTVSIGIAGLAENSDDDGKKLLNKAYRALSQARRDGGDVVRILAV